MDRAWSAASDAAGPAAERWLRVSLIRIRIGELGRARSFAEARGAVERALRADSTRALAWYALGLAREGEARRQLDTPQNLGTRVGMGPMADAARAYLRALRLAPRHGAAAAALAPLVLRLRDSALSAAALDALRAAGPEPGATVLLARGRLERAAGDPDRALADFLAAAADPRARPIAGLEAARTALAAGHAAGDSLYYAGATSDDTATVRGYRDDLALIEGDSALAGFDRTRGAARAEWLRRFWRDRALRELREPGERLREHYRRLAEARARFALTITRRHYGWDDAYRSGSLELDDRGIVWVRHGEPTERLRPFVFRLMPNESWRYARPDGDFLFHFSAGGDERGGGDLYDYRLVESVFDLHGAGWATRDGLLLSRETLSPMYARMLNWGPYGAARAADEERRIGRESIAIGTTTESHLLRFDRPLDAVADLVALGRRGNRGLVHVAVAVRPDSSWPAGSTRVRVRAAAWDASGHVPTLLDTLVELRGPRGEMRLGRAELPLPPGRYSWRVAIDEGNRGQVLPLGATTVSAGDSLAVSELALGSYRVPLVWSPAPGDSVRLSPWESFRRDESIELGYETVGLAPGGTYRHEITVLRARKGLPDRGRPLVALGFDAVASGGTAVARRSVSVAVLRRGDYVLQVRVRGADGAEAVSRRTFRVVDR